MLCVLNNNAIRCCITVAFGIFLLLLCCPLERADAQSDTRNSVQYGVLTYNAENVACVACSPFEVTHDPDGMVIVSTDATDWPRQAANTTRPYLAFTNAGTRLETTNPQLGVVTIDDSVETYAIRFEEATLSREGTKVLFAGSDLDVADMSNVYSATGQVGGVIADDQMQGALDSLEFSDDDEVESTVVDLPSLDAASALLWAESMSGTLEMLVYDEGGSVDTFATENVNFDISKYKGLLSDYGPLGSDGSSLGFMSAEYLDT